MTSQMPVSSAVVEGFEFSGFKLSYFMYFNHLVKLQID